MATKSSSAAKSEKPSKTSKVTTRKAPAPAASTVRKNRNDVFVATDEVVIIKPKPGYKMNPWQRKQYQRLIDLRDDMLDTVTGMAKESLRARSEGSESSAFGMHQADAGSDAYDREFALSLLTQEQDALYEIEEAIKRLEIGTYGICEMSGEKIPQERLEAIPFAKFTVQCQAHHEKQLKISRLRQPVGNLFGPADGEGSDSDDDNSDSKD